MSMKTPLTPAGIEPATYRFVAQLRKEGRERERKEGKEREAPP